MTRQVWKYAWPGSQGVTFGPTPAVLLTASIPDPATVVYVGLQDGWPHLWAEVTPGARERYYTFELVGTGHPVPDRCTHRGTMMGPLVLHVYAHP